MEQTINVSVLYFSFAADRMNQRTGNFQVPSGQRLEEFFSSYLAKGLKAPFSSWMFSINQEWAQGDDVLQDGDQIAVIPPVSGG